MKEKKRENTGNWKRETFHFNSFFSSLVWFLYRALADILRQQGPVPISQYEHENIAAIDGSPKDETPVRTSKNHYTPVHTKASNHGEWCQNRLKDSYVTCVKVRCVEGDLETSDGVFILVL